MRKLLIAIIVFMSLAAQAQEDYMSMDRVARLEKQAEKDRQLYQDKKLPNLQATLDSLQDGTWLAFKIAKENSSLRSSAYACGAYMLYVYTEIMLTEKRYKDMLQFIQKEDVLAYLDLLYEDDDKSKFDDYLLDLPSPSSMPSRMDYKGYGFSNDAYSSNYTNAYYNTAIAAINVTNKYKDAIKYAQAALSTGKLTNNGRENMYLTVAFAYSDDKDAQNLYISTGNFIDNYLDEFLTSDYYKSKLKVLDSIMDRADYGYMKTDNDGRLREKVGRLFYKIGEYNLAYDRIGAAYRKNSRNMDLLWYKADVAKATKDKGKIEATADQLVVTDDQQKLYQWDWEKIAELYDLAGAEDKASDARKRAKKLSGQNNVYVSLGLSPVEYFNHVYPVDLNLRYRKWNHEIGFTWFDSTQGYRFPIKLKDGDKDPIVYKGYSLHYMPKRYFFKGLYIAPRFTYTSKEYTSTLLHTEDNALLTASPTETSWDVTLNLGLKLSLIKRLGVDTYIGYGYGQRTFKTNINQENAKIKDPAGIQERIDTPAYNPLTCGLRLWLYLFKI